MYAVSGLERPVLSLDRSAPGFRCAVLGLCLKKGCPDQGDFDHKCPHADGRCFSWGLERRVLSLESVVLSPERAGLAVKTERWNSQFVQKTDQTGLISGTFYRVSSAPTYSLVFFQ
ncbi:MAG: hypothetical protein IT259_04700 [Saprospiraceae bacterium]|nr:hypothetical protein [Saprospiraceae bacterium]